MKHTNPCDGGRHASTEPCQVWVYTNIKWIKRMGMHIEHCWSHKDAILYFRKKKISENYSVHMNLEEQFSS